MNDDDPGRTVDDNIIVRPDGLGDAFQTQDGRDRHCPGHNGRVGCISAHIGGETDNVVDLQLRRIGRGKVGRDDHHPLPHVDGRPGGVLPDADDPSGGGRSPDGSYVVRSPFA